MNTNARFFIRATSELGQKEIDGLAHNKRILEYHKITSLRASSDEVPWCSSFACWVVEQEGVKSPRSARAADWISWGVKLEKPERGCVVLLSRTGGSGHVGFFSHSEEGLIFLLGGNQNNEVSVAPFDISRVVAYLGAPEADFA